jgi:hypothetical protein
MVPWWWLLIAVWQSVGITFVWVALKREPISIRRDWGMLVAIWLLWPVMFIAQIDD